MCKKLIVLLFLLAFGPATSVEAANIIFVSDNKNTGNTDPVTGGPRDERWIKLLEDEGHVVDSTSFGNAQARVLDQSEIDKLNATDLILVSRNTDSGNYASDAAEVATWNGIEKPLILMCAHIYRNSRWLWMNSGNVGGTIAPLQALLPQHPIFNGVNLDGSDQVAVIDDTTNVGDGNINAADNATIIAVRSDSGQDGIWIAEWEAEEEFFTGSGEIAGGPRMYLALGKGGDSRDGQYNLTADGETLFLNAVAYMAGIKRTKATRPVPADESVTLPTKVLDDGAYMRLTFRPGETAVKHTAYFSDNFDDVNDRVADANLGQAPYEAYPKDYYVGLDYEAIPDFARVPLERGKVYYWAVDETDADGATFEGKVWSFTIKPEKAWDPSPIDGATYVIAEPDVTLSWKMGDVDEGGTVAYNVFYGTDKAAVAAATTPDATATSTNPSVALTGLAPGTTYYWRVDTLVTNGPPPPFETETIAGDVWQFETLPVVAISDPNLVGFWQFEEGQGNTFIFDSSGHENHGTAVGSAQREPGYAADALMFGGTDYVNLPTGIADSNAGSAAMWIKTTQNTRGMLLYGADGTAGDGYGGQNELHVNMEDNGGARFFIQSDGANVSINSSPVNDDEWHHVAATWDNAGESILYVDAARAASTANTGNIFSFSGRIRLGRPNDSSRYYNGLLDEVRLYDRILPAGEIQKIMDPAKAYNSTPANGAEDVELSAKLIWTPGTDESTGSEYTKGDVYFGTSFEDVDTATVPTTTVTGANEYSISLDYYIDYYWRVDGVNASGEAYKGFVWTFKTLYNPAWARDPSPADEATGVASNAILSWTPGDFAPATGGHYVSFGDDPGSLAPLGPQPQTPNNVDPGPLVLGKTYYWSVDEADAGAPDGKIPGLIWSFTTADYMVIDDFETYDWDRQLGADANWVYYVWTDGLANFMYLEDMGGNGTGANIFTQTATFSGGLQAMRFDYDNDGFAENPRTGAQLPRLHKWSKAKADTAELPSGIGADWVSAGGRALSLWFYGDSLNDIEPMWVKLADSSGRAETVIYGNYEGEDPNHITEASWREWNISLQDFSDGGVDLTDVNSIAIGFGEEGDLIGGGYGFVYFDDIRVYVRRCVLSRRTAEFARVDYAPEGNPDGDCLVNYAELEMMAEDWLLSDSNVYGDAVLMNFPLDGSQWVAGKINNALDFDGNNDHVIAEDVYIPRDAFTISLWINPDADMDVNSPRADFLYWGNGNRPHLTFNKVEAGVGGGAIGLWPNTEGPDINPGPLTTITSWTAGTWHHIATTFDGTDFQIYVNGMFEDSVTSPGTHSAASRPFIGSNGGGNNNFDGQIDDFRIYDYALDGTEIWNLASEVSEPAAGPLFWYKFDEASGLDAKDSAETVIYIPLPRPAVDVHQDGTVNFKDYADVMESWLLEGLFP